MPVLCAIALGVNPGEGQAATLRHQVDQRGDFVLLGNTVAQDCDNGVPAVVVGTAATGNACGSNRSDTAPDIFWRSDDGVAANASTSITVADARSTAILALPAGATVTYARLYWSAPQPASGTDTTVTVDRPGVDAFSTTVTAQASQTAVANSRTYYQSTADVTSLVQQRGVGAYRVGGIDTLPLLNLNDETVYVAWSMVVLYRLDSDPPRNLTIFDGLDAIQSTGPSVTVNLSGFVVPNAGFTAKLGVVTYEGDDEYNGDALSFNGVALADASNPANDFFNSTRSLLGVPVSNAGDLPRLTGGPRSMSGVDLDVVDVTARLTQGATSATITASTNLDFYLLGVFVTSISTFKPDFSGITKTVTNLNSRPGGLIFPGDVVQYTITATNLGNDDATQVVMNDAIPAGLTFVPGSIAVTTGANSGTKSDSAGNDQGEYLSGSRTVRVRLGAGANGTSGGTIPIAGSTTVVFRVVVDAAALGAIGNQAIVTAAGASGAPAADYLTRGDGAGGGPPPPTIIIVDRCGQDGDCSGPTPYCLTSTDPNVCVSCRTGADCPGETPTCDVATHACRACAAAADCPAGAPVCLPGGRCGECTASDPGACGGALPACDVAANRCVECVSDATCGAATPVCDTVNKQCVGCLMNDDCAGTTPTCDLALKQCRGCGVDGECGAGSACQPNGSCAQCSASNAVACQGVTPVCNVGSGACVGCTNGSHCGGTAPVCAPLSQSCVPCGGDADCGGALPACQASGACGQCSATNASACVGAAPVCDASAATCVGCLVAGDCAGTAPVCDSGSKTCRGCASDGECGGSTPVCGPAGACVQCQAGNSAACVGARPLCDANNSVCVGCLTVADCGGSTPLCDGGTRSCRGCVDDGECGGATPACLPTGRCGQCSASNPAACGGATALCDPVAGVCVGCVTSADCGGPTPVCDSATRSCRACAVANDCPSSTPVCLQGGACGECSAQNSGACDSPRRQCDVAAARCVECLSASDCPAERPVCDSGTGVCGRCTQDAQCGASTPVCQPDGACAACSQGNRSACSAARPLCDLSSGIGVCVGCTTNADCGGAAPFCSPMTRTCVPCAGDGAPSCPDPQRPVCQTTGPMAGACGECSAADSSRCGGAKPRCLTSFGLCGCSDADGDSDCGVMTSGLICSGAVGICVPGCSAAQMRNGCPAGQTCSATDGAPGRCDVAAGACTGDGDGDCAAPTPTCDSSLGAGRCVQCTSNAGCASPLICALDRAVCVECTVNDATACSASGRGASCLTAGVCGCQSDGDCGGALSGRICDGAVGACTVGCRAAGGNGCPAALVCTSSSSAPGACVPPSPPSGADGGADAAGDGGGDARDAGDADGSDVGAGRTDGGRDGVVEAPSDARPLDGVLTDAGADGRAADGSAVAPDGAVLDQKVGDAAVTAPHVYLAGGGCACQLPTDATPSGAGVAILLALLAFTRRRRTR